MRSWSKEDRRLWKRKNGKNPRRRENTNITGAKITCYTYGYGAEDFKQHKKHPNRVHQEHEATLNKQINYWRNRAEKSEQRQKASSDFYQSDAWRQVRYKALKSANGNCQLCGAAGTKEKPLHVDHIKPRSRFPSLELVLSNLQVLCVDCNLGKGAWDDTDWRIKNALAS